MSAMATIEVNRAPVMTLWAAVVAERLGYTRDEALTLGRAVAGMNAQAKALRVGIRHPAEPEAKPERVSAKASRTVQLLGRHVPVVRTPEGLRAVSKGKPDAPDAVERYLAARFGDSLAAARRAMAALAAAFPKDELAEQAYALYERFRPEVPRGATGWGAKGVLDLAALAKLAPGTPRKPKR
jgi:hypothetical protein